jgi:hypothetical protein
LCLGHGNVDLDESKASYKPGMGLVLIPPDTTLKFYTRAIGSKLMVAGNVPTYKRIAETWRELQADVVPLQPTYTTPNFDLTPETHEEETRVGREVQWQGPTEVISLDPGHGPLCLCDGTPGTCPTPALVAAERRGEKIPAERWKHHCGGLLGTHQGKNIHWMVCAAIRSEAPDAPSEPLTDRQTQEADQTRKYLGNVTRITSLEGDRGDRFWPEDKAAALHQIAKAVPELAEAGRSLTGDIASADRFIKDVARLLNWLGDNGSGAGYRGLASRLSASAVRDAAMAARIAERARETQVPPDLVKAIEATPQAPQGARELNPGERAVSKLLSETVKPLAEALLAILTPGPPG